MFRADIRRVWFRYAEEKGSEREEMVRISANLRRRCVLVRYNDTCN